MTFGKYIRSLRKSQGITQRALSQAVGFRSLAHLSDIESDKRMPARTTFAKLAKALSITVEDLENRDVRECIDAAKSLFAKKPEMVGAFLRVIAAARKLDADELVERVMRPAGEVPEPMPAREVFEPANGIAEVPMPPETPPLDEEISVAIPADDAPIPFPAIREDAKKRVAQPEKDIPSQPTLF